MKNLTAHEWELIHYTLLMAFVDKSAKTTEMLLDEKTDLDSEVFRSLKQESAEILALLKKIS